MDYTTKAYIESLVSPLLSRIQSLQSSNQILKSQVHHLQQIVNNQPSYQKPTLSASQHMKQSRLSSSSKVSQKKATWNNNPKYDSPSKPIHNQVSHEKIKTKPPIPNIMKSPSKPTFQDNKNGSSDKKINGGTKFQANNNSPLQNNQMVKSSATMTEGFYQSQRTKQSKARREKQSQQRRIQRNQLEAKIMQMNKKIADMNFGQRGDVHKSEYDNSKNVSSNSCSFISQSDSKKGLETTKLNAQNELGSIEIK